MENTKKTIQVKALLDNTLYLKGSTKSVYLYVGLQAGRKEIKDQRSPLNISLVIDRSGSMAQENKLGYVKQAANFIVDNLTREDFLSLVTYDDIVDVITKSSPVVNKAILKQKINAIKTQGSTNLSGGMLEGYAQVKTTFASERVNRVFLLSDGLANEGITDPIDMEAIARKKNIEEGITLSSFGVGKDYNEDLMQHLAEYGSGNYFFIGIADKIPDIISHELKRLLAVVAQNTKLIVKFPENKLKVAKVFGYPYQKDTDKIEILFRDIFSEEKRACLIKFDIADSSTDKVVLESQVIYDDALGNYQRIEESISTSFEFTEDAGKIPQNCCWEARQYITMFEANDMMEQAIKYVDMKKIDIAKEILKNARTYMEQQFQIMPPIPELQQVYDNIIRYAKDLIKLEFRPAIFHTIQKGSKLTSHISKTSTPLPPISYKFSDED